MDSKHSVTDLTDFVQEVSGKEDKYAQVLLNMERLAHMNGRQIILACSRWFWQGNIVEVTEHHIILERACMVLSTGDMIDKDAPSMQKIIGDIVAVERRQIEAILVGKAEKID